jgi:RND family efflux transporter MFP subunit
VIRLVLPLSHALLAASLAAGLIASPSARAQTVPTAVLQAAPDGAGFSLSGSLQAVRQSTVAAQVGGNVLQLAVRNGDRVRAGQTLARIDDREPQSALSAAAAAVAQAEALHQNARQHADRTRELSRQGFVSTAAVDAADAQLRAAQAGLDQARAGRTQASLARSFAVVTAPFDAVVVSTHVEAGDLATPGRPLVTLYAPGQLRAVVQVPASRSALARGATTVEVQLPDGRWVAPATRAEGPAADPVSQTVEWRLDLTPAASTDLAPGQAVQVRFSGAAVAGMPARPQVPLSAVLQRGELSAVYAVQDGRFVLKPVRLGAPGADAVEVLAGLKPGERFALDAVRAGLADAKPAP